MAGLLTDEPVPRDAPHPWSAWLPEGATLLALDPPSARPHAPFQQVLDGRRSRRGEDIDWDPVAELLWHACRTLEWNGVGRAGIELEHRAAPSAGGLHPVCVACQMMGREEPPRLYVPGRHAFAVLEAAGETVYQANKDDVIAHLGAAGGCTLRLVGDYQKAAAAYLEPESLLWRDAGALIGVMCLVAEWLGLNCTPLGLVGSRHLDELGFPRARFMGLGAVQVGSRA